MLIRLLAILCCLNAPAQAATVTVFAAASLKAVFDRLAPLVQAETDHELRLVHGGSSSLARQIEAGAPAELFISANIQWMDFLEALGRLDAATRRDLLSNRLTVVTAEPGPPIEVATGLVALVGEGRLALALVDAVPSGIYAKATLQSMDLWEELAPRVVQTDSVTAAARLVASGAIGTGIVYATDATAMPGLHARAFVPEAAHPPITYPAARISGAGEAAQEVLDWLGGDTANDVFRAAGFGTLP